MITRKKLVGKFKEVILSTYKNVNLDISINEEDGFYHIIHTINEDDKVSFENFALDQIKIIFYENNIYSIYFAERK